MNENETYPIEDWKYEVINDDTVLGYEEWLSHKLEADRHDLEDNDDE